MSNVLQKNTIVTVVSPGTPATPGSPGSPGSPAWDEVVDKYIVTAVGESISWTDAGGSHNYNVYFYPTSDISGTTAPAPTDTSPPPSGTPTVSILIYGTLHVHTVIHHPAVLPVPPVPGSPGTPPVVTTNYQLGWNASADSIGTIVASGEFQFSVDQSAIGVFAGLATHAVVNDYEHIPYALYFTNGKVQVYESNDALTSAVSYVDTDVFTIRRLGPEVAYFQGSTLLYRSTVPSAPGNLSAVALMYSGGDTINNASITQSVDVAYSATTAGVGAINVPVPYGRGADADGLARIAVPVPVVAANNDGTGTVLVPIPVVQAHSPDAAAMFTTVPVPTVHGEQPAMVPAFGIGQAVVPFVTAWGVAGQNPGAQITVPVPAPRGYDLDGGCLTRVPVPQVFGIDATSYNVVFVTAPRARAAVDVEVLPDYFNQGIRATAPKPTALLYGGEIISATAKLPTAALTIFSDYNVIAAKVPKPQADIEVSAGCVVSIAASAKLPTAALYSGTFIAATAPRPTADLEGMSGTAVAITATAPEPTASASASAGWKADVVVLAPLPISSGWNFISASAPKPRAVAANDAAYAVTYAYAVTVTNTKNPVTRYTNYPFQSIVRLGNDYLGFGPSGVRKLSGADDAGTPIAWSFQFGRSVAAAGDQSGEGFKKYNKGCYFDGRFTGTVAMTVSVDDGQTYSYAKLMPTAARDKLRVVPGLGLRGFAWQYGLSGIGQMDLYRCEFLQLPLERKVKHG